MQYGVNRVRKLTRQALRHPGAGIRLGGLLLTLYYVGGMLRAKARPGASTLYPLGWWGWWDQSQYLRSAHALARFDLTSAVHWYPLGYAVLGAPFERLMPMHPFLLIDLACLLASFAGFVAFARGCGFPALPAVAAFLFGALGSASIRENWIIPWTTTPTSAAIWLFLALCVRHLGAIRNEARRPRFRRVLWIGMTAVSVPLFRPTDLVVPATGLLLMLGWSLRDRSLRLADPPALLLGAAMLLVPYGLLYLLIYGPHPSEYMVRSRVIGFRLGELPFKTFVLLISARPWFPFGNGLLERLPWMALGFAGMALLPGLPSRTARRGMTMLAVTMLSYMAMFFSYVDLLPSGLWYYDNVHYFMWLLPGFVLFALLLLRALWFGPRKAALLAMAGFLVLSAIRVVPVRVAGGEAARMVQYPMPAPADWQLSYFGHERLTDRNGVFDNVSSMRTIPDDQGLRVISLAAPFVGILAWQDTAGLILPPGATPVRWGATIGFGLPCWLPPYPCLGIRPIH